MWSYLTSLNNIHFILVGILFSVTVYRLYSSFLTPKLNPFIVLILFFILERTVYHASALLPTKVVIYLNILFIVLQIALPILLFKGTFLKKLYYVSVSYLYATSFGLIVSLFISAVSPDYINEALNSTDKNITQFIIGVILIIVVYSIINLLSPLVVSVSKRIREKTTIPPKTWFVFFPFLQAISLIFAFSFVLTDGEAGSFHQPKLNPKLYLAWWIFCAIILLSFILDYFLLRVINNVEKNAEMQYENKQLKSIMEEQYSRYESINRLYQKERIFNHDIKTKLLWISESASKGNNLEVVKMANELGIEINNKYGDVYSQNELINVILRYKFDYADSLDIKISHDISVDTVNISNSDLCSIVSNVIDNAIDSCMKLERNRFIDIKMYYKKNYLVTEVVNSVPEDNDDVEAHTESRHGFGLLILKKITEKYNGYFTVDKDNQTFKTVVFLENVNS